MFVFEERRCKIRSPNVVAFTYSFIAGVGMAKARYSRSTAQQRYRDKDEGKKEEYRLPDPLGRGILLLLLSLALGDTPMRCTL